VTCAAVNDETTKFTKFTKVTKDVSYKRCFVELRVLRDFVATVHGTSQMRILLAGHGKMGQLVHVPRGLLVTCAAVNDETTKFTKVTKDRFVQEMLRGTSCSS
jgi:hypothetical protein